MSALYVICELNVGTVVFGNSFMILLRDFVLFGLTFLLFWWEKRLVSRKERRYSYLYQPPSEIRPLALAGVGCYWRQAGLFRGVRFVHVAS